MRLSNNDIAIRILPTSVRWPDLETIAWQRLRAAKMALHGMAVVDDTSAAVER